jgi:hypothetical protein
MVIREPPGKKTRRVPTAEIESATSGAEVPRSSVGTQRDTGTTQGLQSNAFAVLLHCILILVLI